MLTCRSLKKAWWPCPCKPGMWTWADNQVCKGCKSLPPKWVRQLRQQQASGVQAPRAKGAWGAAPQAPTLGAFAEAARPFRKKRTKRAKGPGSPRGGQQQAAQGWHSEWPSLSPIAPEPAAAVPTSSGPASPAPAGETTGDDITLDGDESDVMHTPQQLSEALAAAERLPIRSSAHEADLSTKLAAAKARARDAKPVSQQVWAHSRKLRKAEVNVAKQQKKLDEGLLAAQRAEQAVEDLKRANAEALAALAAAKDELAECHRANPSLTEAKQSVDAAASSQHGAKLAAEMHDIVAGAVLSATTGGSTHGSDELLARFQAKVAETATALYRTELAARHHAMAEAESARATATAESHAEGARAESAAQAEELRAELAARQLGLAAKTEEVNAAACLQAKARTRAQDTRDEESSSEASRVRAGGRSRSPVGGGVALQCG